MFLQTLEAPCLVENPLEYAPHRFVIQRSAISVEDSRKDGLLSVGLVDRLTEDVLGSTDFSGLLSASIEEPHKLTVDLVDRFVDDGIILTTVTRHRAVQTYHATQRATTIGIPLVLLINGASASAAEIVAGSLQSHGRATIIGRRSFGKGSVQHLIQLKEHPAAVRLTTAYYRLPDGRVIHRTKANAHGNAWGILPDIEVLLNDDEAHAIQQSRWDVDVAFSSMPFSPDDSAGDTPPQRLEILRDRQLLEALSHLRERG